jgi:ribosomal protein L35
MGRRRLTPREKKRLSLERDTPLSAKYPKAFRKHWPRKKAAAEGRALRGRRVAARGDSPS